MALRYLNPKRTLLSAITLVCMLGVAVGVLVLIVVLSVMAGFEREVKERLLGFSPHVELRFVPLGRMDIIPDGVWREMCESIEEVEGVEEAYAQIRDYTILEGENGQVSPIEYRAIDTSNEKQMAALEDLILKEKYGGNAAMGIDEKCVVAETAADQFRLHVGSVIKLHSARNFQELADKYEISKQDLVAIAHAKDLEMARDDLRKKMTAENGGASYDFEEFKVIYDTIWGIWSLPGRDAERGLLSKMLVALEEGEKNEAGDRYTLPVAALATVEGHLDELFAMDRDKENGRYLEGLSEVALPRELEVIGIFKVSTAVLHPKVFLPLPTGQELKNLEGGVETIGLRVADPYKVGPVHKRILEALPPDWTATTWMEENLEFVNLIAKERMMMYFALSFIMLVSAFCICAVMFTVTIQKKQEIGVMKALGAWPAVVVRVFLIQGIIIGFLGAVLGVGLGLLVIRFRGPIHEVMKMVGFDPFPEGFHKIDGIPAHVNPVEVGAIAAGAFVLCTLASLVPAYLASRRDAARCLRNI